MFYLQNTTPMLLIVGGLCALGIYHILSEIVWPQHRRQARSNANPFVHRTDSAEQLRWVMAASFSPKRVMNWHEYKMFKVVETEAYACNCGYRVFAQTSLGEVIRSKDQRAHSAINSKRADVLVVGRDGLPVLAVEFQGQGHYQFDAAARDAVKKEALRRAGVGYLEIFGDDGPDVIRAKVRASLGRKIAA